MHALVVYDSTHGNTAQVANAIGEAIGGQVTQAGKTNPTDLQEYDLLIVGSPTHGGWFTKDIQDLLDAPLSLDGVSMAAFDTRTQSIWNKIFRFGRAAPRIADRLQEQGGTLIAPPEGFVVRGIKGPLKEGELERAANWARELLP